MNSRYLLVMTLLLVLLPCPLLAKTVDTHVSLLVCYLPSQILRPFNSDCRFSSDHPARWLGGGRTSKEEEGN